MENHFNKYLNEVYGILEKTAITGADGVEMERGKGYRLIIEKLKEIKDGGNTLFFAGNGASCSMAEHMSHDFFKNAGINTLTCAETSHLTAISNDLSFDMAFAFKIGRVLKEGDALITISSSGNSPSIIKAIEAAKENRAFVITLSGMGEDNKSRSMGDLNVYAPALTYGLSESVHAVILHFVLDCFLDEHKGGRR